MMLQQQQQRTGWPPGMLQDDDRKVSRWLSNRVDSRMHASEAAEQIRSETKPKINISSGEDAFADV